MLNRARQTYSFIVLAALLGSPQIFAQKPGGGGSPAGGASSGGNAGAGAGNVGNPNNTTNTPIFIPNNPNNQPTLPGMDRPIFLAGKVMFDDGSPANNEIRIERVCGPNKRIEAHTDNKGHFSFQVGGSTSADISSADASETGVGQLGRRDTSLNPLTANGNGRMNSETELIGCDLQASYPGYRSDSVSLTSRRSLDNPDVGTIILHRLSNVQGTTISLTTAEAPKAAVKSYQKGLDAGRKSKFEEAEKHFEDATTAYPKYAIAWFALGQTQQQLNKPEEARKSFLAAAQADSKYVSPYNSLAILAGGEGKWDDVAAYSKRVIELNPVEFPAAFWYNAVANYNLKNDDEAAKSAHTLLKVDTNHRFPEVNRILAELALAKQNYSDAAGYLRTYLQQVPQAKDADNLKKQLLKIEEASAAPKQQ